MDVEIVSTDIDVIKRDPIVRISPNPGSGLFELMVSELDESIEYSIYNEIGQVITQGYVSAAGGIVTESIDLRYEANGMYLLVVNSSTWTDQYKLIVRH
jgi:hypothetical protein